MFLGVINGTAPNPVRLSELCERLGKVVGRPSWLPVPEFALKAVLGEGASVVIFIFLASCESFTFCEQCYECFQTWFTISSKPATHQLHNFHENKKQTIGGLRSIQNSNIQILGH